MTTTQKLTGKQELALQMAKMAVETWRQTHEYVIEERANSRIAIQRAVDAGVPQATIAEAVGWPRQRVHTVLNER